MIDVKSDDDEDDDDNGDDDADDDDRMRAVDVSTPEDGIFGIVICVVESVYEDKVEGLEGVVPFEIDKVLVGKYVVWCSGVGCIGQPRSSNLIAIWLCHVSGTILIHLAFTEHIKVFVTGEFSSLLASHICNRTKRLFKVDKKAMIWNRYNRIPHPAPNTIWERDKPENTNMPLCKSFPRILLADCRCLRIKSQLVK